MKTDMQKYVILNADDYGASPDTNTGVEELFKGGFISSSSLLTVTKHSLEAVVCAEKKKYPVGVHFTINSDDAHSRWVSNSNAKSLSDEYGLLINGPRLSFRAKSCDVRNELDAQFQYMVDRGVLPDHADSHCGTLYGINGRLFFRIAFDFCKNHALPFRFPKRPDFLARQFNGKIPFPLKQLHGIVLHSARRYRIALLDDMVTDPRSIQQIKSYENLRSYYLDQLTAVKPGITEMIFHPCKPAAAGPSTPDNAWLKREFEYALLKSGDLLEAAKDLKINIVSWSQAPFGFTEV